MAKDVLPSEPKEDTRDWNLFTARVERVSQKRSWFNKDSKEGKAKMNWFWSRLLTST